jgi:hypothetical protein
MSMNQNASANSAARDQSAYALAGASLIANGFSAVPIDPMGKRPDPSLGTGWQRYCSRLPTPLEVDLWSKRSVGVGVALGAASGGLVVIDIDVDDVDVIEAIESRWPSTVRKVGRTGYSAFYRASPAVRPRAFRRPSGGGVDLLAAGRQAVLPPSRHPGTCEPYRWLTPRTLENTVIDELPSLPDDVAAQLAEALEPFGFTAPAARAPVDRAGAGEENEWRETNEIALANLSAWVKDLGIGAKRKGASWRGNARRNGDSFALSFHPNGIRDFVTDEGFSPIDIVAKILDIEPFEAMRKLREKLGLYVEPEPPPVHVTFRKTLTRDAPEADYRQEERQSNPAAQSRAEAKPGRRIINRPTATPFVRRPLRAPECLYGGHYFRQFLNMTVAMPGAGKTTNGITEFLGMAIGYDLIQTGGIRFGKQSKPLVTWYVNGEDPQFLIDLRFAAAMQRYGITHEDIKGKLFVDSGRTS